MGWLSDAWDEVTDAAETVVGGAVDAASGAVHGAVNAAGNAMGDVFDVAQGLGGGVFGALQTVEGVAVGVGGSTLNVLDDYVFDTVDWVTHGAVDVDYDNGNFSAGINAGITHAGVNFGQDGFGVDGGFNLGVVHGATSVGSDGISTGGGFNLGVASGSATFSDDDGFHVGGSAGIDFGPLPFVEGHIDVAPDGGVSIGGELQGVLPGLHPDVEVNLFGGAGDGDQTSSDFDGVPGTSELDQAIATDLDQLDTVAFLDAGSDALGTDGPALVDDGLDDGLDDQPGDQFDDQPGVVFAQVTDTVSDLAASGDLSEVLGDLDGSDGGVAQQVEAVGQLVEDNSFDDFTSDVVGSELTEASADDVWSGIGDDVDG